MIGKWNSFCCHKTLCQPYNELTPDIDPCYVGFETAGSCHETQKSWGSWRKLCNILCRDLCTRGTNVLSVHLGTMWYNARSDAIFSHSRRIFNNAEKPPIEREVAEQLSGYYDATEIWRWLISHVELANYPNRLVRVLRPSKCSAHSHSSSYCC